MAHGLTAVAERRAGVRSAPSASVWSPTAILRPGHEITIVNLASGGVLIRTATRVVPGKRVDLQLLGEGKRHTAAGRVLRCRVVAISPLCYEAAIVVEEGLTVEQRTLQE